ncbi:MAG: cupin domain-containing protein [Haloplanus sp.]
MPERTTLADLDETPHAEVFEIEAHRPRVVRLRLAADERIPRHTHEGTNVVLHLLDGRLELTLDDETYDLDPGDVIRFSGEREVSPYAVEPSTAVAVFAPAES